MAAPRALQVHPDDNVAVAVEPLAAGTTVSVGTVEVTLRDDVPKGHKVALRDLAPGAPVVKYGARLGDTTEAVAAGAWVHSHNLRTALGDLHEYAYEPTDRPAPDVPDAAPTFLGYRRPDGRVGTRNEIWVINTVACVNRAAERIARTANARFEGRVDGVHSFQHPYGCSQLGDDLDYTQRVLAGLIRHPNAGGVLVIGLGCENNRLDALLEQAGDVDRSRIRYFTSQLVGDEVEEGLEMVEELVGIVETDERTACPVSDLVLGVKCGGSDAFSGITANPLVGRVSDRLTALGGTVLQTEVPEMFGAEQQIMNRAATREVFEQTVDLINRFKQYFIDHDQPIYENPSPGNKDGGLTTLEEKSLGATQKGGTATVTAVLDYGEPTVEAGLNLIYAPGNDGVSVTAEVVAGATVVVFTTGRGTPLGFPVPTLKVSTNSDIAARKPHWIDFDAGRLLDGSASMDQLTDDLFDTIRQTASGERRARNEENDYREIAIWKDGVTL
ncbi:UxaA family hydrolase [Rubrivirga marina]|uniref:Altronate hydrolase n=1 Tax=Rubrivirga marina TaxID=1196024 RepID=A0A271IXE2_9BACT|nr:altronate dehydratase family protein [Rubrivirga marina]PAP75385.1 altronate hydrolase [Rubrivirga marina]